MGKSISSFKPSEKAQVEAEGHGLQKINML